jgi:hypothetical protein
MIILLLLLKKVTMKVSTFIFCNVNIANMLSKKLPHVIGVVHLKLVIRSLLVFITKSRDVLTLVTYT